MGRGRGQNCIDAEHRSAQIIVERSVVLAHHLAPEPEPRPAEGDDEIEDGAQAVLRDAQAGVAHLDPD